MAATDPQGSDRKGRLLKRRDQLRLSPRQALLEALRQDPGDILETVDARALRSRVRARVRAVLADHGMEPSMDELSALCARLVADVQDFGPLAFLLENESVTGIMVVGHARIYHHRGPYGTRLSPLKFQGEKHLRQVIDRLIAPLGEHVDEDRPILDLRLPDRSRLNVVIPPIAVDGSVLTVWTLHKAPLTVQNLIDYGVATIPMFEYLRASVIAGLNVLVSGMPGAGKTALLNVLCGFIPADERIVTVEQTDELVLGQEHVIRLVSRSPRPGGSPEVSMRALLVNATRMSPECLVVDQLRGGETLDWLQIMSSSWIGSLATIHAGSPPDALRRLQSLAYLAGIDTSPAAVARLIAHNLSLVVQVERLADGSRKVTRIAEVQGLEGDALTLADIFVFEQDPAAGRGKVTGVFKPTGIRPQTLDRIIDVGIQLPPQTFGP